MNEYNRLYQHAPTCTPTPNPKILLMMVGVLAMIVNRLTHTPSTTSYAIVTRGNVVAKYDLIFPPIYISASFQMASQLPVVVDIPVYKVDLPVNNYYMY